MAIAIAALKAIASWSAPWRLKNLVFSKSDPSLSSTLTILTLDSVTSLYHHSALLPLYKTRERLGWWKLRWWVLDRQISGHMRLPLAPLEDWEVCLDSREKWSSQIPHQLCVAWKIEVSWKNNSQFSNDYFLAFVLDPITKGKTT